MSNLPFTTQPIKSFSATSASRDRVLVAQVLGDMNYGGMESVVMNYFRNVDKDRVQFDFFFHQCSDFPQREELEASRTRFYEIPRYTRIHSYIQTLTCLLRENRYDIIHVHLNTMGVFALYAAWAAGIPTRICHNHSTAYWGEGSRAALKYLLRPFARLFATDCFACGKLAGKWMFGHRAMIKGRVYVLPNAIDIPRFAYDQQARTQVRDELGIGNNDLVLGHVGRFVYQKNHRFLLDIFRQVHSMEPSAHLLLIGEGERKEAMYAYATELGVADAVHFLEPRRDIHRFYSSMDVFVLPSFFEGLPVVGLEAQANGLPCIFSNHVPEEAVVTPSAVRLALALGPQTWADRILTTKRVATPALPDAFDITKQGEYLTELYWRMARRRTEEVTHEGATDFPDRTRL